HGSDPVHSGRSLRGLRLPSRREGHSHMSADDGLRKILAKYLPKPIWHWTPIETGGTANGVPDTYWVSPGQERHGWLECKATTGWAVHVEPHQISWMDRAVAAGAR